MVKRVHTAVGPHRGHRDDAVVGLAQPAQLLPTHMCGGRAVPAVPGVVDHDHSVGVRSGRGLTAHQVKPSAVDLLGVPDGLGQKVLQSLRRSCSRADNRLRSGQTGDRLVPL